MARKKRNQFDVDEIYRGLRTNIEFSQMDDAIQVINVVSTIPNEGKSTIACNLARIMAAKYKNVLLIDCDLRNASVHKTLQISNRSGLTNIISEFKEGVSIHSFEGVQDVQYDGGYPLSVITVGHKVPNPSEVLGSKRLAKFLNQARQEFGYIIIDCPPVAVASDAIPLCNVSDGVLYVVDSKISDKRKVKAAINDVERNGGHVMGVVLNKVESARTVIMAMATDMVMEEKTMVKRRKRNSFIILASTLLLTGCGNSELEITQNDILEVARDDANATKKECSNVSIREEKKYYTVSFDTTTGSYEYKIGKDGIIQERNYKKSNSEEKEEVSTSESVEEPKTKKEEKKESTSFDENQQQAINAALANAGLGQEDVTDIGCTLDEATQQYTVTFTFQDIKNTCMVDAANFVVLSSIQG